VGGDTRFWAIIRKVQTLTDGSLNVTLNLPEDAIPEAAELMAYQVHGVVVNVTCEPRKTGHKQGNGEKRDDVDERPKRKSEWTSAEGPSTN